MRIAIVGCGEVGTTYARALLEAGGPDLVLVDPAPRAVLADLAAEHHLSVHAGPGPWLHDVDAAWLCVAGDIAHEVLADACGSLPEGVQVLDLTTASPDDKRRSAALLAGAGTYVDVVIMGDRHGRRRHPPARRRARRRGCHRRARRDRCACAGAARGRPR
ncbi:NAD(P)-binding domain-containing protein [Janibacter indicus]|uniref:NAD(P)-binding domain-containing protein n=1 Tax=Janibacter indicus TaxID=857417 RepID=UPI003D9A5D4F